MGEFRAHGVEGRITTFDIAAIAGVSQSVVSRVLRGESSVPAETRQRIAKIATDLGYQEDPRLRPRTNTLTVVIFHNPAIGDPLAHPFFIEMLGAITHVAAEHGYEILLVLEARYDGNLSYSLGPGKSDGVIVLGTGEFHIYQRYLAQMSRMGIPFVRYSGIRGDTTEQPVIRGDNYHGGLSAARHLIALGRKRIVFLGNISGQISAFAERFRGYAHALQEGAAIPLPPLQMNAHIPVESGRAATQVLLSRGEAFDAILAANDMIAIGALQALRSGGVPVPEAVSVVGFGDTPAAELVTPSLTTVRLDMEHAGKTLVETLLQLIAGQPVEGQMLTPHLVIRDSCGANLN